MNSDKIHTAYFSLTNQNRIIMVVLKLEYIGIGIELCRDWHAVWVRLIITLAAVAITMTLFVSRCLVDFVFSSHSTRALSGVPCRFVIALVRMNFAEAAIYWIRVWFYMLFIAVWANLFCFCCLYFHWSAIDGKWSWGHWKTSDTRPQPEDCRTVNKIIVRCSLDYTNALDRLDYLLWCSFRRWVRWLYCRQ